MKKFIYMFAGMFILFMVLYGCSSKSNDITDTVGISFRKNNVVFADSLKTCFVIPGAGCPGCIASGIHFLNQNRQYFSKNQKGNFVVFTNVASKKLLNRALKGLDLSELNAVIDTKGMYTIDSQESKYPLIIFLEKGRIIRVDYQSPTNNGIEIYKKYLSEQ